MERLANRILLTTGWKRALLALCAGAIAVLGQAPFHLFIVCFLSFPVLVWLLDGAVSRPTRSLVGTVWPAFATGWWFGFGYFVAGLWWIGNALFVEATEFAWLWPFAVTLIPAALAVFYGLAAVFARMLWSDGLARIAALAFGFGLAEWLRSFVFTGFPWNAVGYAAMPVPVLMQSASLVGIYGMNALAVFVFALPAAFARGRWRAGFAAVLVVALLGAHAGYGYWRLGEAADAGMDAPLVRIVQPAIDQSEKWDAAARTEIFDTLTALTTEPGPSGQQPGIVVWPETSVPYLLTEAPAAVAAIAAALGPDQVLLAGAPRGGELDPSTGERSYYNSILVLNGDGVIIDAADKKHLVPFGEYLPFKAMLEKLGMKAIAAADRGYSPAERRRTMTLPDGLVVLPSVCYEAIFPYAVAAEGDRPTVLVNVTNDAWYGDTPGPYQHAHQARIRALETGLPVIRAANNGISAIYDPYGRQLDALGYGVRGAVEAHLPDPLGGTWYARNGRVTFAAILAFLALAGFFGRRDGRKRA
jgi:apolipoprotein N-acyltransferase